MPRRRLTRRQQERIAQLQEKRRERLARAIEEKLSDRDSATARPGRVIRRHGQNLLVQDDEGRTHHCLFRQNLGEIVCGDRVLWQPAGDDQGVVVALLPRDSVLTRPDYSGRDKPLAANITQLVVVLAPKPEPAGYLTDQYLVAAELMGVKALITLNKADLLDDEALQQFQRRFAHYERIDYPVITVSAKREHGLEPLLERLRGETSILVGQSGVGKSSLINALIPEQPEAVFRLGKISRQELEKGFREFLPYLGKCRFSNCSHHQEPGCALKEAVERGEIHPQRLENFLLMAEKLDTSESSIS